MCNWSFWGRKEWCTVKLVVESVSQSRRALCKNASNNRKVQVINRITLKNLSKECSSWWKEEHWKPGNGVSGTVWWLKLDVWSLSELLVFSPQLLPQRCIWLYVMNNVLMSVSGNKQRDTNWEHCVHSIICCSKKAPSCREVGPALLAQPASSVWTERTSAQETQQPVTQHQPPHWADQSQVRHAITDAGKQEL